MEGLRAGITGNNSENKVKTRQETSQNPGKSPRKRGLSVPVALLRCVSEKLATIGWPEGGRPLCAHERFKPVLRRGGPCAIQSFRSSVRERAGNSAQKGIPLLTLLVIYLRLRPSTQGFLPFLSPGLPPATRSGACSGTAVTVRRGWYTQECTGWVYRVVYALPTMVGR